MITNLPEFRNTPLYENGTYEGVFAENSGILELGHKFTNKTLYFSPLKICMFLSVINEWLWVPLYIHHYIP